MDRLSSPVRAFIADECEVGPMQEVGVKELFRGYCSFCFTCNRRPGDIETFGRDLRAALPEIETKQRRVDGKRERYYRGIALRETVSCADRSYGHVYITYQ